MQRNTFVGGLLSCTLWLGSAGPAWAKPEEGFRRSPVAPQYRLQPGDKLEITVDSLPETEKVYQVRSDGIIQHPVAGEVSAAGKTVLEVQKILRSRFENFLRRPSFRVGVYSVAEIDVAAVGEVVKQGKFSLANGASMLDLLAEAGGPNPRADTEAVILVRDENETVLNLKSMSKSELSKFKLKNGDVLTVNAGKRISVMGEVREPGAFPVSYKSATPIDDALKNAGGTKPSAALNRVLLVRATLKKPIPIDLNQRDAAGRLLQPVELEDGDILDVQSQRAVVLGAVDRQGPVVLTGDETLFDIVSSVGASKGKLNEVVVIRAADVQSGSEKRETYNLDDAFKEAKSIPKVPILDGDVVFVPPQDQPGMFSGGGWLNMLFMARSLFAI